MRPSVDWLTGPDSRRRVALVSGLVGIVALVVVLWVLLGGGDDQAGPSSSPTEVGGCVAAPGDATAVACDKLSASYRVEAEASDGCDRAEVEQDGLCLDWNASEGDCFLPGNRTEPAMKVDCAEHVGDPAVQRVDRVGKAGESCANGGLPRLNATRGSLLCLVEPTA
ncbi:hypothetical protein ACFQ0K_14630 [Nocardioides caeni]|uniref:Uncharacterized protein n=1 Tax=Nocardioides caeni TaxID=574700 RepID=A0A4S8NDG3_9ACTN|nr:hypothetical protein [Nocardioides caeni]THV14607.1 hypothetical protein E9934_08045 [Nocardioides caeni]